MSSMPRSRSAGEQEAQEGGRENADYDRLAPLRGLEAGRGETNDHGVEPNPDDILRPPVQSTGHEHIGRSLTSTERAIKQSGRRYLRKGLPGRGARSGGLIDMANDLLRRQFEAEHDPRRGSTRPTPVTRDSRRGIEVAGRAGALLMKTKAARSRRRAGQTQAIRDALCAYAAAGCGGESAI
ncbi:hypothetical protein FHT72_006229 [Rhizobium sp. BK077]|nr:hypothetical protein [Rhizobium sp. BK112]MBB3371697.1 hypothetical protein [Rhizobium sp. BK077]MBB4182467.1 hypothetical protein [Rhizobium sp. BK109]